jgi:hypothetical protein
MYENMATGEVDLAFYGQQPTRALSVAMSALTETVADEFRSSVLKAAAPEAHARIIETLRAFRNSTDPIHIRLNPKTVRGILYEANNPSFGGAPLDLPSRKIDYHDVPDIPALYPRGSKNPPGGV